jgi:hypothetical protein
MYSSELIEKHKAFENAQIVEYNAVTAGFGIAKILDDIKMSPMPHDSSWKENILKHHAHYKTLCDGFILSSILLIKNGQRAGWQESLKTALQNIRKKTDKQKQPKPPIFKILEVLAVASAYWTVDIYAAGSHDDECDDGADMNDVNSILELKRPHAAQIVTIFRLLV